MQRYEEIHDSEIHIPDYPMPPFRTGEIFFYGFKQSLESYLNQTFTLVTFLLTTWF